VDRARLVTYYTAFVIELCTRRVHVLGSTPHPDGAFVVQAFRGLTGGADDVLHDGRILICDRDPNSSWATEELLRAAGVRVVPHAGRGAELQCICRTLCAVD
jgi:putative transposase